ncbi:MAG TPA: Ohr family peroxiredoxin [Opitutaceae bacterium]
MKTIVTGSMISENGRAGKVEAPDGELIVDFSRNEDGRVLTPEHLFAGAYAACFHSALKSAAERGHRQLVGSVVTANVRLQEDEKGGYRLAVELAATMPGVSESDAEHLLHQAHTSCPYSKATRGNVDVQLKLD